MTIEKYYMVRYTKQPNVSCTNNAELFSDEVMFEDEESARKFIDDLNENNDLVWAQLKIYEIYYPDKNSA